MQCHLLLPKTPDYRFENQNSCFVIYVKSLKNSFEKVNYSVKFEIMGGGGKIITGREWLQVVGAKLCWSWVVWVVVAKLWLVGDGRC